MVGAGPHVHGDAIGDPDPHVTDRGPGIDVSGSLGAPSIVTSTVPMTTCSCSVRPPAEPSPTYTYSSPTSASGRTPIRAASPATNPVPANSAAGTTSHRARPRNAPTSSPPPQTTAAAPSHCSGCRRPPFAWSIRAPTAATTTATPIVRRPRIDGGRAGRCGSRTRRRAAGSVSGPPVGEPAGASSAAPGPGTTLRGGAPGVAATGRRRARRAGRGRRADRRGTGSPG